MIRPQLTDSHCKQPRPGNKATQLVQQEILQFSLRSWLLHALSRLIVPGTGGRLRPAVFRALGLPIGQGTLIGADFTLASGRGSHRRLRVGNRCFINSNVYIDAAALVTLGNGVSIGHHVVIITTNHTIGSSDFRAGAVQTKPVIIEDGAWVAAGVTLLPGVTVGRGAVVAAGAVVSRDVAPNTLVGGVPAKLIRHLET